MKIKIMWKKINDHSNCSFSLKWIHSWQIRSLRQIISFSTRYFYHILIKNFGVNNCIHRQFLILMTMQIIKQHFSSLFFQKKFV